MRLSIPIDDLPRHFAGRETLPAREHGRVIVDSVIIEGPEILAAGGMQPPKAVALAVFRQSAWRNDVRLGRVPVPNISGAVRRFFPRRSNGRRNLHFGAGRQNCRDRGAFASIESGLQRDLSKHFGLRPVRPRDRLRAAANCAREPQKSLGVSNRGMR